MKQIERIRQMEERFDRASAAVRTLSEALDNFQKVQADLVELENYYGSTLWKKDFNDDEAQRLPADLKRGVLSEDGLWNLLESAEELRERVKEASA